MRSEDIPSSFGLIACQEDAICLMAVKGLAKRDAQVVGKRLGAIQQGG